MVSGVSAASGATAWIAIVISIIAIAVSTYSVWTARRSLHLAERQEARRDPKLVPYIAHGYYVRTPDARVFAFSTSVGNPTDTSNSLANVELEVRYKTPSGLAATIRLPHDPTLKRHLGERQLNVLEVAQRLDAHSTTAGWLFFEFKDALRNGAIDGYLIIFQDSHNLPTALAPGIISEIHDEVTSSEDSAV
jgi:hypothetical protein